MTKTTAQILTILQDALEDLEDQSDGSTPTMTKEIAEIEVLVRYGANLYRDTMVVPEDEEVLKTFRKIAAIIMRMGKNHDMPEVS